MSTRQQLIGALKRQHQQAMSEINDIEDSYTYIGTKDYSKQKGRNVLVESQNDGKLNTQTYVDPDGYRCTIVKEKNHIKNISVNVPYGNKGTQVSISAQDLWGWEDISMIEAKISVRHLAKAISEKGASLAEIYDNYGEYAENSHVPPQKRAELVARYHQEQTQENKDNELKMTDLALRARGISR